MSAIRSLTFLVTLAMLSAVAWSRVGNCSIPLEEPVTLISPNGATVLNAFGRHGYIYSAFDGVVYPESFHVLINFTGAGERNKTYPTRRCSTPTGLLSTPWDTNAGRGLAAPLLNFYDASTFDCYPYRAKKVLNGVEIDGLYVRYSTPDFPDAGILFSYEFTSEDLEIIPSNDTTYTHGNLFSFKWVANRLKVTAAFTNFPWSQPPSASNLTTQFTSAHFQLDTVLAAHGSGYFEDSIQSTLLRYNTSHQALEFEFEKSFYVDGVPFDNDQSYAGDPMFFEDLENDIPLSSHIGIGICDDNFGQWKEAIYDPQLSAIFLRPPTPAELDQQTPFQKKTNLVVVIVVPIVVVLAVAIVAATIITILSKPALRAKFAPSLARDASIVTRTSTVKGDTASPTKPATASVSPSTTTTATSQAPAPTQASNDSGWTKSARPTQ